MQSIIQSPDMIYVFYMLIALGVFLLFTGVTQFLRRDESQGEAKSRRMQMIAKGAKTAELLALLKPENANKGFGRLPLFGDLPKLILQAGLTFRPMTFLMFCGAATIVAFFVAVQFLAPLPSIALSIGL